MGLPANMFASQELETTQQAYALKLMLLLLLLLMMMMLLCRIQIKLEVFFKYP